MVSGSYKVSLLRKVYEPFKVGIEAHLERIS